MFLDFLPLIGDVVNTAGTAISGSLNYKNQVKLMDRQNVYNRQMADLNYQRGLDMWNLQNEYNSPSASVQRLKDAGLNPALMYGGGSVAGNASTAPQSNIPSSVPAPTNPRYNFGNVGSDITSGIIESMQLKNMAINVANAKEDLRKKQIDNDFTAFKNDIDKNYYEENAKNSSEKIGNESMLSYFRKEEEGFNYPFYEQISEMRRDTMRQVLNKAVEDALQSKYVTDYIQPKQKEKLIAEISSINFSNDAKEIANDIDRVLLEEGVDLRGGALERFLYALVSALGSANLPSWLAPAGEVASEILKHMGGRRGKKSTVTHIHTKK